MARARNQRHVRRARADKARDQVTRRAPGGAIVQPHVSRARAVGQVRNQRHRGHALLRQRVDGFAHHRMFQRHEGNAVGALAVLGQRLGQRVRVEAFNVFDLALGVQRAEVFMRIADGVAQHAQVPVAATRQQEHQPHRLGRQGGGQFLFGQIVQFHGGLQHLLGGVGAHAGPAIQHTIGGGGRHTGACGHIGQTG